MCRGQDWLDRLVRIALYLMALWPQWVLWHKSILHFQIYLSNMCCVCVNLLHETLFPSTEAWPQMSLYSALRAVRIAALALSHHNNASDIHEGVAKSSFQLAESCVLFFKTISTHLCQQCFHFPLQVNVTLAACRLLDNTPTKNSELNWC